VALPPWEAQVRDYVRTRTLAACGVIGRRPLISTEGS